MYIRTKDGVYDLENDDIVKINGKYKKCYVQKDTGDTCFKDIEILKRSENLEELCDEFVLIEHYSDRKDKYHHRDKESFIEDYIGYEHIDIVLSYYTIYGAIWTDKGLIYVAKMNSEGKLVLI